jgi:hypothetical protein
MYVMARRVAICLALTLVVTAAAVAKEATTATLLGHPRLGAKPGTRIKVAWRFATAAAGAARCNPGDRRVYVRLVSATGARSTRAYGTPCGRRYVATERIPRGGVGDVEILMVGYMMWAGSDEMHRADALIPITNDPFP